MRASNLSCNGAFNRPCSCCPSIIPARFNSQQFYLPVHTKFHGNGRRCFHHLKCVAAVHRGSTASLSSWDDEPYEVLPNGKIAYLDEQDVVTFLDPPKELIPLDPSSYNPASYLWKKIGSIPEHRRNRLLSLLKPRLISRAWEIAGMRYDDPKLATKSASSLLCDENEAMSLEYWNCRTSGGPLTIAWMNFFRKVLFYSEERKLCGRLVGMPGNASVLFLMNSLFPFLPPLPRSLSDWFQHANNRIGKFYIWYAHYFGVIDVSINFIFWSSLHWFPWCGFACHFLFYTK